MAEKFIYQIELKNFTHDETSNIFVEKKVLKQYFPLHSHHDYIEIEYCAGGEGYQNLNGERYNIKKGTFFLAAHSDTHEIFPVKPLILITISFKYTIIPSSLGQYFCLAHKDNLYFESTNNPNYFDSLFKKAHKEYCSQDSYSITNLENILSLILVEILRMKHLNINNSTNNAKAFVDAINYINMHFLDNPSLTDVAKSVYLTPSYFSSYFKKYSGQTFKNYINELKVKQAKKLLRAGTSVTDACYSCGFSSLNDFSRTFRKSVGQTPADYKKNKNTNSI